MAEKLPEWSAWLFSTPWWVPALLATAMTVWMMWASYPRQSAKGTVSTDSTSDSGAKLIHEKRMLMKEERNRKDLAARPQDDHAVTLRAGPEVGFDCSKGSRFYLELSTNAFLLGPENPREGAYDLIVLQGDDPKTFAYAIAYEIDLENFPVIDDTPNSLTVIRIDILKFGSKFRYFPTRIGGQPMNVADKAALNITKHQNFR